jgi:ABC-2 type transport system permease protein
MLALAISAARRQPLGAYIFFEIRRQLRNRRFIVVSMALPVGLYLVYTAVMRGPEGQSQEGISWPAYFLVSMAAYGAMAAAITQATPIAVERASGWVRQLRVSPLPGLAYVGTKIAAAICLTVPALVLVSVAGIAINHVALPLRTWLELILVLALGALPFAAFAILLGYSLEPDSAQGAVTISFFALAIVGGLFAPVDAFPDTVATIARMLPSYHLAALGRQVVAGRVPELADVAVLVGYTLVLGALAAWRFVASEQRGR